MSSKRSSWEDLKKKMAALTQDEWDEFNLKAKIVGEIINARRNENLTQRILEELSELKQPMIDRIESGETDPQLGTILKLLRPLG